MKKILIAVLLIVFISSCENKPHIGYIVCKEHILERMSNENATKYVESSFAPHHIIIFSHSSPHKINERYILYVANKDEVRAKNVSKKVFDYFNIKNKVKVYQDTIYKLQD